MRFSISSYLLSLAALVFTPASSLAQVASTNFTVQITIQAACQINSAGNLNFGTNGVIGSDIDATSDVIVQCTASTPFSLGLSAGAGSGATVANRLMTSPAGATISYSLYTTAAHSTVWGNTVGTDRQMGTGTGAPQTFTVYGRVPAQTTPAVGVYTDTVTATLNY
ncbi:Csu type fimbrial protein [Agrobacterium tumefaciens]|uniref:Csu type fimbrial protein n=1 Tax=Agrobacterium tumefaciens TaxID=358 RepID=UPI0027831461|nr:spore coat U domain-containing protein [Agrobacterium tumefaciens]MDP9873864.1 spore coat protein U-like protein [Agrobacterium tumefaciens]MDP9979089.1 spore coat protein U-like protein [Agrobacterium tumefaciens]